MRFELTGFQTILRDGIQLSAGFEARIEVVLKLSTVQEAITVSGQSPVIDVTTTTVSSNLSHEVLDTIPTSRSLGEAIALAPGVRYSGAIDVGGNRTGQFASGGNNFGSDQQSPFLEGINTRLFEGGSMAYLDQRALDEIQVTAVGSSAEFATPGVAWTGVVKSGGNDFHGLLSYDGQYPALQATNVDDALIAQGLSPSGNSIESYYDFTGTARRQNRARQALVLRRLPQHPARVQRARLLGVQGARRQVRHRRRPAGHAHDVEPRPDGEAVVPAGGAAPLHRVRQPLDQERARARREPVRAARIDVELLVRPDAVEGRVPCGHRPSRVMVSAMVGDSSYLAQWRAQDGADVPGNPMTSDIFTGYTTGPAATARNPNKNHQFNASMNYYPDGPFWASTS